jgi:WD40 repeat protein
MFDDPAKDQRASTSAQDARQSDDRRTHTLSQADRTTDGGSGRLEVRCPSCHVPMEVAVDTKLTDLTCKVCGSHFSLVDQSKATRIAPSLSKLGRFELIERLGVGGYGSVWKARDNELDRTVAVKIPRAGAMTADEQEKFFREARAAAQLRHPNIVSVHEVGRDGDSVYIVSDFVRGVTLGDWLTGQQLTNREAAELCAKIADALDHAHEQGVVHRDLKPANIMIDDDSQPHLMDFGLARRDAGEITVTMDGQVLGTPAYMSPEQAQGEAHTADRRSDIYSLGVVLFQLLTGELPFRGNARMLIHQVINDPAPSPRKLNGNVRKDLETITLKCMEKDPARRYQTAKDLADELRRYLAGKPIQARPVGHLERSWRWCQRNPIPAALSAALLLTLVIISTIAPIIATRQVSLRHEAEAAEAEATREAATAKRLADVEGAKYALTQARIAEAYQQIAAAIKNQPSLEYGRILDKIVDNARNDWQLIQRIPTNQAPNWGCFAGPGPKWFILSHGATVEVRSLLRDQMLSNIQLPEGGYAPRTIGADKIAIALKTGGIALYSLPNLQSLANCDLPDKVLDIRSDANGTYFVALNDRGLARVYDTKGNSLASTQFKFVDRIEVAHPTIDISPSGRNVLYHPGRNGKKQIWEWKSNNLQSFDCPTFVSRFGSDGLLFGIRTAETHALIGQTDIKSSQTNWLPLNEEGPFLYTDGSLFEGAGDGKSPLDVASICEEAIHLISDAKRRHESSPSLHMEITRYHSLWPQAPVHPEFLAYDSATHTLALATDRDIVLFTRWLPNQPGSDFSASLETQWRNLAQARNMIFTCRYNMLQSLNLQTLEKHKYRLEPPKPAKNYVIRLEQVAVTSNAKVAAIQWHEISVVDGKMGRLFVQILKLPEATNGESIESMNEIELKDLFNQTTRESGRLIISPDATIVATYSPYGVFTGYRVIDGSQVFNVKIAESTTFAPCSDPPLLAVADYARPTGVRIFNAMTGKVISQIAAQTPAQKVALSPDGKFIYVGWMKSRALGKYRVADGSVVSEIKTPVLPVAISPSERRFVGFYADAPRVGSLVLGDLKSAKVVEHVADDAFILDNACFSSDEDKIVYTHADECGIMKTPELAEAEKRLERSAINPELATASADLLEYRERLAQSFQNDAEKAKNSNSSHAGELFKQALTVSEGLYSDFPTQRKYGEIVAALHDSIAVQDEQNGMINGIISQGSNAGSSVRLVDWSSTRQHLESALVVRKKLSADFPNVAEYKSAAEKSQKRLDDFNARHKLNENGASQP